VGAIKTRKEQESKREGVTSADVTTGRKRAIERGGRDSEKETTRERKRGERKRREKRGRGKGILAYCREMCLEWRQ